MVNQFEHSDDIHLVTFCSIALYFHIPVQMLELVIRRTHTFYIRVFNFFQFFYLYCTVKNHSVHSFVCSIVNDKNYRILVNKLKFYKMRI